MTSPSNHTPPHTRGVFFFSYIQTKPIPVKLKGTITPESRTIHSIKLPNICIPIPSSPLQVNQGQGDINSAIVKNIVKDVAAKTTHKTKEMIAIFNNFFFIL